jgi:ABC-2 type transport system permease protein
MNTIARKDWLEFVRDRRLVLMAALIAILTLAAIATSFVRITTHERDRLATEARDRATWENQGERNPHGVAHFASWALRPMTALSLLDPGVTPYAGSAVWMEAHNQNPARARPIEDSASAFDLGAFGVAWILQTLMPLLIMVIAAGAISRERERGTHRLMLASGASAKTILPAKVKSIARIAAMLIVPLVGVALLTSLLGGAGDFARLMLWGFGYLIFFAIITLISVAISARARSTSQAMLMVIGLWLAAVMLAPRAGAGLAKTVAPTPTADSFWASISDDFDKQPDVFGKDSEAFGRAMAKRYGVKRIEDLPVSLDGLRLNEDERHGNFVFDKNYNALASTYAKQRATFRWANVISPLPALQNISMALAGTDTAHQLAFQRQAELHRRGLMAKLNGDMIANGAGKDFDYLAKPDLWKSTRNFKFVPPSLGTSLRSIWPDALILICWLIAALLMIRASVRQLSRELH